jgi:ribosomal protein L25 (general stress protein Ctc)
MLSNSSMAKRLSVKHRKMNKDKARAYSANKAPWDCKIAEKRSKKALKKKAYRMT